MRNSPKAPAEIRAEITDGSHPDVTRQGTFVRTIPAGDGWQERLREEIREIHLDTLDDRPFQVRLYRGNPTRVGDRVVLDFHGRDV